MNTKTSQNAVLVIENKPQELQDQCNKYLCFKGCPNLENLTYLKNAKNNIVPEIKNCNIHRFVISY